jgi:Cd2+/Zn2+-exporting ATPase
MDAERWVDRFAAVYTPLVIVSATLMFLVPPLLLGASWADWI